MRTLGVWILIALAAALAFLLAWLFGWLGAGDLRGRPDSVEPGPQTFTAVLLVPYAIRHAVAREPHGRMLSYRPNVCNRASTA
jgi:hypothetical protein